MQLCTPAGRLVDTARACVEALGIDAGGGGPAAEPWADRVAAGGETAGMVPRRSVSGPDGALQSSSSAPERPLQVRAALDRAERYVGVLLAENPGEASKELATRFYTLSTALGRPMSATVLAAAAPTSPPAASSDGVRPPDGGTLELVVRVLTGDEVTLKVAPTATAEEARAGANSRQ